MLLADFRSFSGLKRQLDLGDPIIFFDARIRRRTIKASSLSGHSEKHERRIG